MNWWHYLLLANLYLALFYGFYLLLLRTETYFMLNRIYLVSAAILSFFIPMMQAEWVKNLFITQKVQQTIYYIDPGFVYQIKPAAESSFTIAQFFTSVYWLVAILLLARLFYRFVLLRRYLQSEETGSAFSFFGKIKVDENLPQKDVILQHELIHAAQFHSADVLLFEVLAILNWFNPIIYFYRKAIKHIHEFIADRDAISFGVDKSDYALLLLSQSMGVQPNILVNSFFNQSLLKQRIMMLHKNPSRRLALLKYGLSAPLFVVMLIFTSATVSEQKTIKIISDKISSDATVKEVASDFKNEFTASAKITSTKKSVVKTVSALKGKVVNISGDPLAGVKITYTKKNNEVTTDQNGDFKISNYTDGDLLTFEYVGFGIIAKSFTNEKGKLPVVVLQGSRSAMASSITINKNPVNGEPVSFALVEKLPSFPGGNTAFGEYLAKTIRYPKIAHDQNIQGRVIASFIVEKDGKLNDIKVLRDIGGGCGMETIRVLSASPAWNPGTIKGEPVRVAYTMPINFTLEGGKNNQRSTWSIGSKGDSTTTGEKLNNVAVVGYGSSDSSKRIRGIRVNGKNNPIVYIIDGDTKKEIKAKDFNKINPNDIESISVLNDTSATAKYGDRAKDGVIEITMKKGKKP